MLFWNRFDSRSPMRHYLGIFLQLIVLACLPGLIYWQLINGIRLVMMPTLTMVGIVLFWVGTRLREGK